jgi:hypothetical protein
MNDQADPFFQVPRTTHATTEGPIELPILYYDVSALVAFFAADREAVEAKLDGTGLRPALTIGRRAIVGIACYEYRKTSVGPYHEVGIALPVLPEGAPAPRNLIRALYGSVDERHLGFFILDLPVTTAVANAGGRELWGYPKFVTSIPLRLDKTRFEGSVLDPDGDGVIFTLSGRLLPSLPAPPMSLVLYSHQRGNLLRATVDVRGRMHLRPGRSLRLRVGESPHPMAANLRMLGLDRAHPALVLDTHRFQSRLHAGVPIGRVAAARDTAFDEKRIQP